VIGPSAANDWHSIYSAKSRVEVRKLDKNVPGLGLGLKKD